MGANLSGGVVRRGAGWAVEADGGQVFSWGPLTLLLHGAPPVCAAGPDAVAAEVRAHYLEHGALPVLGGAVRRRRRAGAVVSRPRRSAALLPRRRRRPALRRGVGPPGRSRRRGDPQPRRPADLLPLRPHRRPGNPVRRLPSAAPRRGGGLGRQLPAAAAKAPPVQPDRWAGLRRRPGAAD